jgi:hypothetical protein
MNPIKSSYQINMMNQLIPSVMIVAIVASLAAPAIAQNTHYSHGDLVLTFQKEGSTNTIYINLGSAAGFRGTAAGAADGTNRIKFLNIGVALDSAYGSDWAGDTAIYAGLAAVYSTNSTNSTVTDGDASRTLYVSAARNEVGTVGSASSSGYTVNTNTGMNSGASSILGQNNVFESGYDAEVAISPTSSSQIDDCNPFLSPSIQGTAFGIFGGGIQQVGSADSFGILGGAGNVEFALDLYRIVGKTVAGAVAGDVRIGSYEGTVAIDSSGWVSFVAKGASTATPFETWIAGYPSVTSTADKAAEADPDGDGFGNLTEFVLGGDPTLASASITPTLSVTGGGMALGFYRSAASVGNTTAVVQYSTDLSSWSETGVTTPSTAGFQTVSIPSSSAANGKLFTRLKVTRP